MNRKVVCCSGERSWDRVIIFLEELGYYWGSPKSKLRPIYLDTSPFVILYYDNKDIYRLVRGAQNDIEYTDEVYTVNDIIEEFSGDSELENARRIIYED